VLERFVPLCVCVCVCVCALFLAIVETKSYNLCHMCHYLITNCHFNVIYATINRANCTF
jgi:hypothetical protein